MAVLALNGSNVPISLARSSRMALLALNGSIRMLCSSTLFANLFIGLALLTELWLFRFGRRIGRTVTDILQMEASTSQNDLAEVFRVHAGRESR